MIKGRWGTVCDDMWDVADAKVVCRQLGYQNAIAGPSKAYFGRGSGLISLHDVQCTGDETTVLECSQRLGNHNCDHSQDAGVVCSGKNHYAS